MSTIQIKVAGPADSQVVSDLVKSLFLELEQEVDEEEIDSMNLWQITLGLINRSKILVSLAYDNNQPIRVVTLNECAAIYAGGTFVEISELYVRPEFRSKGVGRELVAFVREQAKQRKWARIEVGAPEKQQWPKTLKFYLSNGFQEIGPRLRSLA